MVVDGLRDIVLFPQNSRVVNATVMLEQPEMEILEENADTGFTVNWGKVFVFLLAGGMIFFAMRFLWQLLSIFHIRAKSEKCTVFGTDIYHLPGETTPFSFFKWIFINTETHSEEELRQILLHERTHAAQYHSVDIVLMELLCIAFWWNPFVWMMRREMAINLEYLADNSVLRHGINCREYQYYLLRLTYHETAVQIVNNFNVSQLKQRIMMMNKTKSPARKLAKYLLILPLTFALITANSCTSKDKSADENQSEEVTAVTPPATDTVSQNLEPLGEAFVVVEQQPEFPGGNAAMMKFLGDNIKYPVVAQENGIQGRVITNFVVEKDGKLTEFQVVRGIDPALDEEAIRVLKSMPNWTPGKQDGENVRVRFTLPVVFRLEGGDSKKSAGIPPPPPLPPTSGDKKTSTAPPPPPPPAAYTKSTDELKNTNEVFVVVQEQPEFPGGNAAMMRFIGDNVDYPRVAQENGTQGRVICNFIIEKDGSLSDVKVVRGVDTALDEEAVRVIKSMPNWKPGKQRGQNVRVRYTLPVVFRLQE